MSRLCSYPPILVISCERLWATRILLSFVMIMAIWFYQKNIPKLHGPVLVMQEM